MLHAASGFRWIALAALLATWLLLTPAVSSPASHGLDPMPRQHNKRSGGGVGRKAAMGERSHWEHALFDKVKGEVQKSAHTFLHDRHKTPLVLPMEVNIVMVGLDGGGAYRYRVDEEALSTFLHDSFSHFRPSCLETGKQLEVSIELHYNVMHAEPRHLTTLEDALRKNMVRVDDEAPPHEWADGSSGTGQGINWGLGGKWKAYEVEASGDVEKAVDGIYHDIFASLNPRMKKLEPIAILLLSPDKLRMDPSRPEDSGAVRTAGGKPPEDMTAKELEAEEGGYVYRYRYMGSEGSTAAWLGAGRYAVLDLAAGPCTLARIGRGGGAEEGVTTGASLPRLAPLLLPYARYLAAGSHGPSTVKDLARRRDAHLRGHLSTLVLSSVRHLLAPDVKVETLDFAQRVLLPVIVLRDHNHFSPLHKSSGRHHLDTDVVKAEARKLLQPGQELVVVSGTHNLHDHEHLAMALLRAQRMSSRADRRNAGTGPQHNHTYHVTTRAYLDSAVLLEEFRHSADLLASGLVGLEDPSMDATFFNAHVPNPHVQIGGARGKRERLQSHGTRVVPVYVLSLAGLPPGVLLDGESLVAAAADLVVVVQAASNASAAAPGAEHIGAWHRGVEGEAEATAAELAKAAEDKAEHVKGHGPRHASIVAAAAAAAARVADLGTGTGEWVPLRFTSQGRVVRARPAEPTRHVVAGVGMALGGLVEPTERFSPVHARRMENWLWSVGHHPFGPFGNCSTLSAALADVAHRNAILSRTDTALRAVRASLEDVESFSEEYLATPFGDFSDELLIGSGGVKGNAGKESDGDKKEGGRDGAVRRHRGPSTPEQSWLDHLYEDPERSGLPGPLPQSVVAAMEEELKELEEMFVRLGAKLYNHDLEEAHVLSSSLIITTHTFRAYVAQELSAARQTLRCCRTEHRAPGRPHVRLYAAVLVVGAVLYGLIIFACGGMGGGGSSLKGSALKQSSAAARRRYNKYID